jgi:hypothetical protein
MLEPSGPVQACNGIALPLPLGGSQGRSERVGDEKNLLPLSGFEPRFQSVALKDIPAPKQPARLNDISGSGCTAIHILSLVARWSGQLRALCD